ncbi:MAG: hypothetical protein ACI39F_07500 [Acutalibacteraceae bacterium]
MDDITSKITELLNDPEGMQRISSLASSIMQADDKEEKAPNKQKNDSNFGDNLPIDPAQMGNIMKMMSVLKQQDTNDDNAKLLIALKPHLSEERRKKVDKAVSLLKVVKLLPILKESGMLNLLGG